MIQLVDPSGNLVENGMYTMRALVPAVADCTRGGQDVSWCLPEAGLSFSNNFYYRPMGDCNCLLGTLSAPVVDGYATFTDLAINVALRRVRLMFYSSNGLNNF